MSCTNKPPTDPVDKQVFTDCEYVTWVFDAELDLWVRQGTIADFQLASDTQSGLVSAADKTVLDYFPVTPGGFGIIIDDRSPLISKSNPNGLMTGDIKLVSGSLKISCDNATGLRSEESISNITVSISDAFKDNFYFNYPGPKGETGDQGANGPVGEAGFSNGPKGDVGIKGINAINLCEITGIDYVDDEGLTSEAIVDVRVISAGADGSKLVVTKAPLNLPGKSPGCIIAQPLGRGVTPGVICTIGGAKIDSLDGMTVVKTGLDSVDTNVYLLRIPKGPGSATVDLNASFRIQDFVDNICEAYNEKLAELDEKWGLEAKSYINSLDAKARTMLSSLANELSMCEFSLPSVEYGITFVGCPPPPPTPIPPTPVPRAPAPSAPRAPAVPNSGGTPVTPAPTPTPPTPTPPTPTPPTPTSPNILPPPAPAPVPAAPAPVPAAPAPTPTAPAPTPTAPVPVPTAPVPTPTAPAPEGYTDKYLLTVPNKKAAPAIVKNGTVLP